MLTIRFIFILLLFFQSLNISGQEYPCSFEYKHYSGEIGGSRAVMDVMITNDMISGSCVFTEDTFTDGSLRGLIRTSRLEGILDEHGITTIAVHEQNSEVGKLSGIWGKEFTGTFREEGTKRSRSFNFQEEYVPNSIPFAGFCLTQDSILLDTINPPYAHLELSLLLPPDKEEYKPIREAIGKIFLKKDILERNDDGLLLSNYAAEYFKKYVSSNIDLYDGGLSFNWELINTSYIGMNHNGLLVYRMDSYGYTGGAHGIGISRFLVFDLENMVLLDLNDIFIEGSEHELSQMLERSYRENYYIGAEQSLSEAGLWSNEIPLSENFFLTENGIGFYYNPYKIAPYSMGSQVISLKWQDIEPLVLENSAVRKLISE